MTDGSTDQRRRPLGWVLALAALALWSCGSPEERYRTLSIFFDGVPLPDSMRPVVEGEDGHGVALVIVQHPPYEAGNCEDCHGPVRQRSMSLAAYNGLKSDICLKCHEGKQTEFPAMHGPVAAVECLACHDPHSSRYTHLLKTSTPKLCLQCHVAEDLMASGAPEHNDLTADCLSCHYGHGGIDPYFLRIDLNPPTQPDDAPTENTPETDSPEENPAPEGAPTESQSDHAGNGMRP